MIIAEGSQILDGQKNTYTLTERLGNGGFGTVYKAVRDSDSCIVAVKTFSSSFASKESIDA